MNFTVMTYLVKNSFFKRKVIIGPYRIDKTILLLRYPMRITNPFPPIAQLANSTFMLTNKVRFVVVLVEATRLFGSVINSWWDPRPPLPEWEVKWVKVGRHILHLFLHSVPGPRRNIVKESHRFTFCYMKIIAVPWQYAIFCSSGYAIVESNKSTL